MISVTILTKNAEETLGSALESLRNFEEIILLDSGSTDCTLELAKIYPNVKIFEAEFIGFGFLNNLAAGYASNDWILSIDSDEILTSELEKEIFSLQLDALCVYSFSRKNYFNGKLIKRCGWYPDYQLRLYNRSKTSFPSVKTPTRLIKDGVKEVILRHHIKHYSCRSISDFLYKIERYSSLYAEQYRHIKKPSIMQAILRGGCAFIKSYILKRGFLEGREGYVISIYHAHTAFYKYLKLAYYK